MTMSSASVGRDPFGVRRSTATPPPLDTRPAPEGKRVHNLVERGATGYRQSAKGGPPRLGYRGYPVRRNLGCLVRSRGESGQACWQALVMARSLDELATSSIGNGHFDWVSIRATNCPSHLQVFNALDRNAVGL